MHILLILFIPSIILITLYRMWLNAQVYRIKYDYDKPIDPKARNFSAEEIERMNESSLFILFCFFTFFWFRFNDRYRTFQVRSNFMMLLTLIVIMMFVWSMTKALSG